jgi:hypothetical protein
MFAQISAKILTLPSPFMSLATFGFTKSFHDV